MTSFKKIKTVGGTPTPGQKQKLNLANVCTNMAILTKCRDFRRPQRFNEEHADERKATLQSNCTVRDNQYDCVGNHLFKRLRLTPKRFKNRRDHDIYSYLDGIYQSLERIRLENRRLRQQILRQHGNERIKRENIRKNIDTFKIITANFVLNFESDAFSSYTKHNNTYLPMVGIIRNINLARIFDFTVCASASTNKLFITPTKSLNMWTRATFMKHSAPSMSEECFRDHFGQVTVRDLYSQVSRDSLMMITYLARNLGHVFLPKEKCISRRHLISDVTFFFFEKINALFKVLDDTNTHLVMLEEAIISDIERKKIQQNIVNIIPRDARIASLQSLLETTVRFDAASMRSLIEGVRDSLAMSITTTTKKACKFLLKVAYCAVLIWCIQKVVDCTLSVAGQLAHWYSALDALQLCSLFMFSSAVSICISQLCSFFKRENSDLTLGQFTSRAMGDERHATLQASGDNHNVIALVINAVHMIFTGKETWTLADIKKEVSAFPRFGQGVTSLVDVIGDIINFVKEKICNEYFGTSFDTHLVDDPEIQKFHSLVSNIVKAHQQGQIYKSSIIQAQVVEAETLGLKLIQRKGLGELRHGIITQWRELKRIIDLLGLAGHSLRGQRIAPVIIVLQGDTNVGKSTIVTQLAIELINKIAEQEQLDKSQIHLNDMLYTRNTEQEFWDQYHGQLVCIFDDFAQRKDFAQTPNLEFFEIIRAGNTFPYPLHMATLEEKNITLFQSRVIICTQNTKRPRMESVAHPDAVYRRFDIAVSMEKNVEKYPNKTPPAEFIPDYHIFREYDIKQENVPFTNKIFDMEGLVNEAFAKYQERFCFENQRRRHAAETAKKYGFRADPQGLFDWFSFRSPVLAPSPCEGCLGIDTYHRPMTLATFKKYNECQKQRNEVDCVDEAIARLFQAQRTWLECFAAFKDRVVEYFRDHKALFAALGMLACVFAAKKMYNWFTSTRASTESYEAKPTKGKATTRQSTSKRAVRSLKKEVKANLETADNQAVDICSMLFRKSNYMLRVGNQNIGNCFFIRGRILCFPRHYVPAIEYAHSVDKDIKVEIFTRMENKTTSYQMTASDFIAGYNPVYDDEMYDMATIDFVTAVDHLDITKHFPTIEESKKMKHVAVGLTGQRISSDVHMLHVNNSIARSCQRIVDGRNVFGMELEGTKFEMKFQTDDYFEYALSTIKGDCGSLLVAYDIMIPHKILGMHVMGIENESLGFSLPLYKEDILKHLELYEKDAVIESPEISRKADLNCSPFVGECEIIGLSEYTYEVPPVSKIQKSLLHPDNNEFAWRESVKRPSLLHRVKVKENDDFMPNQGEYFDPKKFRLENCCQKSQCVDQKLLDMVKYYYKDRLKRQLVSTVIPDYCRSRATDDEYICGVDGDPYISAVNRKTSPGYGWFPEKGKPGKTTWFGNEEKPSLTLPGAKVVLEQIRELEQQALTLKRVDNIFIDTLKDELLPLKKFWKTRVFSACEMKYLLAVKKYYQGIVALLTRHRIKTGIAVGINVYSAEWDVLAKYLTGLSSHVVAGDFKNFDSSLLTQILRAAFWILHELIKELFPDCTDEDNLIRTVLSHDLFNSYHCCGNILYMWTHSLPSGHYLTAIINSLYVNLVMYYLFCLVLKVVYAYEVYESCEQLRIIAYGDDHIVAIPIQYLALFNQNTLVKLFESIGMTYTDEQKHDTLFLCPDSRTISEVTFLKRSFRFERQLGRFVAPLTLDTVLETPYWVHKSSHAGEIVQTNAQWAIHELALHDQDIFDLWTKRITTACECKLFWTPVFYGSRVEHIKKLEITLTECDLL